MSLLTAALANCGGAHKLQVAASSAIAASLASGIQAAGRSLADTPGLGPQASLSSPPRPATIAGHMRGSAVTPSYCLAGAKTRRRRRRRSSPDGEPGGGGGDDGGGDNGSGSNNWWGGPWDEEPDEEPDPQPGAASLAEDWIWNMCGLLVLLQTLHFLLLRAQAARQLLAGGGSVQVAPALPPAGFATLSQAFFARRGGLRALPPRPCLSAA